jgi:hypothetical protein
LSFLIKCAFWLAVVFWALPWRAEESTARNAVPNAMERAASSPRANTAARRVAKPAESIGALLNDVASDAGAALARTARDYCATHAAQCLSAAAAGAGLAAPPDADDKRLKSKGK